MRQVHQAVLDAVCSLRPPPRALLDIGCNDGAFTAALASALPAAAVTAMDPAQREGVASRPNITFVRGFAERLPFPAETFDAAVAALSVHHWDDKASGIKEAYRVLKRGGRLVIGDPLLEGWLKKRFLGWLMQAIDRGSFTDAQRLTGYLREAGFTSIKIRLIPHSMKALYLITAEKA